MPRLNNGGNSRCQCAECDEFFNSLGAFDKHRHGEHATGRFCRTPAEMLELGMAKNAEGFWVGAIVEGGFWGAGKADQPEDPTDGLFDDEDFEDLI